MVKKRTTYKDFGFDTSLTRRAPFFKKSQSLEDKMRIRKLDLEISSIIKKPILDEKEKAPSNPNGLLVFQENGEITYISPTKEIYNTKLRKKTNSYNLLKFLVVNPHKVFGFNKLEMYLEKVGHNVGYSTNERRVRDTIQSIKKKLKYQGQDLFESNKGFGLKCDVQIKK